MRIEHVGYSVEKPVEVADWYVRHLGFKVTRSLGAPTHTHFLADSAGRGMVEIYNNPSVPPPDYRTVHPLLLHLALVVEGDIEAERDRLVAAGAQVAEDLTLTPAGDRLVMLRDPWGFPVQLAHRKRALL